MKMKAKDYELIASSVRRTKQVTEMLEKNQIKKQAKLAALRLVASDLSGSLYGENMKFDRNRFLKACGIHECLNLDSNDNETWCLDCGTEIK
jgi:hypothetical protein